MKAFYSNLKTLIFTNKGKRLIGVNGILLARPYEEKTINTFIYSYRAH